LNSTGFSVCAVVVTYNRKELLQQCLTSLLTQSHPLDEVIVVDNASTDGTEDAVSTRFPQFKYVKLPENLGGAGGFHEGMRLAYERGHDWIWVMDDDAIPAEDALEALLKCPRLSGDDVYALASTVVQADGSIFLVHRRLFDRKRAKQTPVPAERYDEGCVEVDMASFVALLVSRKAIEEIGLPLAELFIYYDDTEYSLRMRQKGLIVTVSDSRVCHPQSWGGAGRWAQLREALTWREYYAIRNRVFTLRKYSHAGVFFYADLLMKTIATAVVTLVLKERRFQGLLIVIRGTGDGLLGRLGRNPSYCPE
jgi:rhamnopyranosyl-N-acetylglucosaminyl-diphospho-decaprenol beta-1,3/1,4-galactofuranosyltransferase